MSWDDEFTSAPTFAPITIGLNYVYVVSLIMLGMVIIGVGVAIAFPQKEAIIRPEFGWIAIAVGVWTLGMGLFFLVDRRPRLIVQQHELIDVIGGAGSIPKKNIVDVRWMQVGPGRYLFLRLRSASQVARCRKSWLSRVSFSRPDGVRPDELTIPLFALNVDADQLVAVLKIWARNSNSLY